MSNREREEWEYVDDEDDGCREIVVNEENDPYDLAYISAAKAYQSTEDRSAELRRMPYEQYLRSPHWRTTRQRALLRAGRQCHRCWATNRRLEVHHLDYERLGRERESDLIVLCSLCHRVEHLQQPYSPDVALVLQKLEFIGASAEQIAEVLADSSKIKRLAEAWRKVA